MPQKTFTHIAKLVKTERGKTDASQGDWSEKLGYKNPQFISNVERGKCGMPFKHFLALLKMNFKREDLWAAVLMDFAENFDRIFQK